MTASKFVIEIETEDEGVAERIYAALNERIEAWLHCPFVVHPPGRSAKPKAAKKADAEA